MTINYCFNGLKITFGLLLTCLVFSESGAAQTSRRIPIVEATPSTDTPKKKPVVITRVVKQIDFSSLVVTSEPRAKISLRPSLGGKIVEKIADDRGAVIFAFPKPGKYTVTASKEGFETIEDDKVIILAQKQNVLSLSLSKLTSTILLVTNAQKGVVSYIFSTVRGKNPDGSLITEELSEVSSTVKIKDGRARLPSLDKGYYNLEITAPGYKKKLTTIAVSDSEHDPTESGQKTFRIDLEIDEDLTRAAEIVSQEVKAAVRGKYYALIIGNNGYKDFPKLETAVIDAKEISKILRTQYGFESTLLIDATRSQILDGINAYEESLLPEDSLLIYYAGHGYFDVKRDRQYWLPVDAQKASRSNWISSDDVLSNLKASVAKHLLIISDSCFAGMAVRDVSQEVQEQKDRKATLLKMVAKKSKRLIGSGNNEPVADGGGNGHSVFARAVITGLNSTELDEFSSLELFSEYLLKVAARASQMPVYRNLPNMDDDGGDFVFIRKKP